MQVRPWPKFTCDLGAWRRRERLNQRWLPRSASAPRAEPLADALPVMQPAKDARSFLRWLVPIVRCASAGRLPAVTAAALPRGPACEGASSTGSCRSAPDPRQRVRILLDLGLQGRHRVARAGTRPSAASSRNSVSSASLVSPSASSSDAPSREPAQTAREAPLQAACPRHLTSTDFRFRSTCSSRPSRCVEAAAPHTRGPSLCASRAPTGTATGRPFGRSGRARGREKQSHLVLSEPVLRITFRCIRGSQRAVRRRPSRDDLMQKEMLWKAGFTNRRYSTMTQFFILLTFPRIPPN
jgi:hypothetical protein